ncbi:glycosyltransferase [Chlorogloea sp. CCALA 695]|nr:glycosyltransferase [Chlorogloea sp. CCALA 695]
MREEWDYFDIVLPSSDFPSVLQKLKTKFIRSSQYSAILSTGLYLPIQYKIDDWCSDSLVNFINWKCSKFFISTIFVEYVFLSKVLVSLPKDILKIIDTHDVFANRHIDLSKNAINSKFFTTSAKEEIKGLNRADLVIAIQEKEKTYFQKQIDSEVIELTHIEERKNIDKKYTCLNSIGLIASSNDINVRSIQIFLDLISEKETLSSLKIYIAGKGSLKISSSSPNVTILGQIDSLDYFYNIADLYVNPMIAGTGIKIKSIEAFSYGVPLLSTKIGCVGTGSNFEFHNYPNLEQLVDQLDKLYLSRTSLSLYQEASQSCFDDYEASLKFQLETLLARLEKRKHESN